jgi:hypothetical protein
MAVAAGKADQLRGLERGDSAADDEQDSGHQPKPRNRRRSQRSSVAGGFGAAE